MLEVVNKITALLTIAGQIFILVSIFFFLKYRKDHENSFLKFFGRNGLIFAFVVSASSVAISLFYSDVIGFEPCKLCWLQRIFMYPQIFLLGLGWIKKDFKIVDYALLLALIGASISLYHNYIYYGGSPILPCDVFGMEVSCAKRYIFEFGYITIPSMSLTAFGLLLVFLGLQRFYNKLS